MAQRETVQLWMLVPSSDYIENPKEFFYRTHQILKTLPENSARIFHGYQHESPSEEAYILSVARTDDDIHALQRDSPSLIGHTNISVYFKNMEAIIPALEAPLVELAFITLKSGFTQEDVGMHLDTLVNQDTSTVSGATWGPTSRPELLVMIVGWESLEAHEQVTKNPTPEISTLFGEFLPKVELKVVHVKLHEA